MTRDSSRGKKKREMDDKRFHPKKKKREPDDERFLQRKQKARN